MGSSLLHLSRATQFQAFRSDTRVLRKPHRNECWEASESPMYQALQSGGLVILPKALSRPCCRCQQRCEKFHAGDPWILYEVFLLAGAELAARRTCSCLWIGWGNSCPYFGSLGF